MKIKLIFAALLSLVCVSALSAQVHRDRTWVSPCTLDVVLVTFDYATERAGGYDYHLHDRTPIRECRRVPVTHYASSSGCLAVATAACRIRLW